jgi:hypothetical protein
MADYNESTCSRTFASHVENLATGLSVMGMGLACRDTYRALVEMAEIARQLHNFEPYVPVEADRIVALARAREAQPQHEATPNQGQGLPFLLPEDGKVH